MSSLLVSRSLRTIIRMSHSVRSLSNMTTEPDCHIFDPSTNQLESPSFDPTTIAETLTSYCNDWRRALEFFHWVESSDPRFSHTTETYNRMLDILGKFFEFDLSWDLIQRMRKNPVSMPNHATFKLMFKRYALAHMVKEAVETYNKMEEFGLKDETSYCNLIDMLCDHKHVVEAQDLLRSPKGLRFEKSTKMCNMILRGWLRVGWFTKCREFWVEMDKRGVKKDLHSYTIYMDALCKSGKPWKAVMLYNEMRRKRMKLDVVAYNTVILAIGLSEGVDFAARILREMKENGCKPNVASYNTIVKLLCQNGRFGDAYKALDEMRKCGCNPDVITYHCFFGSMQKAKETLELFDKMVASGVRPRVDTFVMLMRKFGRWGFLRPILVLWNKMEELGCSPDAASYNALIDALIDKKMIDMARKYDEEMLAKGLSPRPRAELGSKRVDDDE